MSETQEFLDFFDFDTRDVWDLLGFDSTIEQENIFSNLAELDVVKNNLYSIG